MNGAQGPLTNALPLKQPANRELLGGDLVAQSLHALGVRVAFGLHGGHLDSFLMGCADIGIRLVDTRHETVAVQAAEGYAKVAGEVGVCFVTANSGFSNGLPGLASALADRSPIFCVTSSPPLRDAETNTLQGFHQQDIMSKPITKWAHRVTIVEEIPRLVAKAFRTCIASPPGPVVLDIPIDVLFTPPQESRIAWGSIARPLPYPPAPHPDTLKIALEMLRQAERPVIITGMGARSGAQELKKFVEATGTPHFNSPKYGGVLPLGHPLRGGLAGKLAFLRLQKEKQPDLIILVGARTGFLLGDRSGAILPNKDCKYIQIDTDGSEIGRTMPIDLGIISDSALALAALNKELAQSAPIQVSAAWAKTATGLKTTRSPHEDDPLESSPGRPHPYHAIKKFFQSLNPGALLILDGGESGVWCQDLLEEHARASNYLYATGYLGFLGNGWGYSLGAAVAAPDRQIVNLQGDGSAGFHIQELDTYARHGLNILTVIFNNYAWGMSKSGQDIMYGDVRDVRPAVRLSEGCAYEVAAQGFGCASARVDKIDDIEAAVQRLSKAGTAACLNLIISDKPIVGATIAMVGKPKTKKEAENLIVVPYYDNLPRPYYK